MVLKDGLFELEDIKPQLSEQQIKTMEHLIFMAKELEKPQRGANDLGLDLIVWPSGKLQKFVKEELDKCETCGKILNE